MREFLKWMAASAIGTVLGLFAFSALVGVGIGGTIAYLVATSARNQEPEVTSDSVLVLDLAIDIQDAIPPWGAGAVIEETLSGSSPRAISIYQAIQGIKHAVEDDDIVGLYIYGNSAEGFATLRELRDAIAAFKAAGKPVIAYQIGVSERDYYVTSVADTLYLDAAGRLEINGFQSETQFLAGALQKYGVGVQVLQAGRYKSAVEPFIRTTSSPESEEQTQALLGDLWEEFLTTVAAERSPTQAQLQQLADAGGLLLPAAAQAAGLVDEVVSYDDVLAELQSLTGEDVSIGEDVASIDLVSYSKVAARQQMDSANIAVVYAEGNIILGQGRDGFIGSESLPRTLRKLRLDDDIEAVVLRINSPGGSATASEILTEAIERLRAEKPVVVSMGNFAASGGYMMATGAERIFASPTTITGSIGVFGLLLNFQDIANRNGITWDIQKTAKFADIGSVARPQTPEELALQQAVVNQLYDRFLTLVADSQEMTKTAVDTVAQGRVWSGEDAQTAGLVDEIGGLEAAIAYAAEQAELETWTVGEYPRPQFLELRILGGLLGQVSSRFAPGDHPLAQELDSLQNTAQLLKKLEDPQGAYTRLPFTTRIH